jgi:hypothetical protein
MGAASAKEADFRQDPSTKSERAILFSVVETMKIEHVLRAFGSDDAGSQCAPGARTAKSQGDGAA